MGDFKTREIMEKVEIFHGEFCVELFDEFINEGFNASCKYDIIYIEQ